MDYFLSWNKTYHNEACQITCAACRLLGHSVVLKSFKQGLLSCLEVFTHWYLSLCLLPLMLSVHSQPPHFQILFSIFQTYDTVTLPCSMFTVGFHFFKYCSILPPCQNAKCHEHSNNGKTTALLLFSNLLWMGRVQRYHNLVFLYVAGLGVSTFSHNKRLYVLGVSEIQTHPPLPVANWEPCVAVMCHP